MIAAGITSLVQSEVVQAEPILLAELSQLETKTEVSFLEEKRLIKHFRKAKFFTSWDQEAKEEIENISGFRTKTGAGWW